MKIMNKILADDPNTDMVAMKGIKPNHYTVYVDKGPNKFLGECIARDVFAYNRDSAIGTVRTS